MTSKGCGKADPASGPGLEAPGGGRAARRPVTPTIGASSSSPKDCATVDQRIWLTVNAIPEGCIATYGDVAERAGLPGAARRVGAALRRLQPDSAVPWHRVVNASGRSSLPPGPDGADRQRAKLADEGVLLGRGGRAVLKRHRWT